MLYLRTQFSKYIVIHTDASNPSHGLEILHENRLIVFYSIKLNPSQRRYITMEKDLLRIVETHREFKTVLLGYEIKIHKDHKDLVHETLLIFSNLVMKWRLIIEEYSPNSCYMSKQYRCRQVELDTYYRQSPGQIYLINLCTKKYASTQDINDQFPLDVAVIT